MKQTTVDEITEKVSNMNTSNNNNSTKKEEVATNQSSLKINQAPEHEIVLFVKVS